MVAYIRKPDWLRASPLTSEVSARVPRLLKTLKLGTVCESASCPNRGRCFGEGTATFMILGDNCTRSCRYCGVTNGQPQTVDPQEPERIGQAVQELGLCYVVVTSVTRDDLSDGGSAHFARTISVLRKRETSVEVLVPDFAGSLSSLETVVAAGPTVLGHNIETVPRLYRTVRPGADYPRSLALLTFATKLDSALATKSGIMLGLGETIEEVLNVLRDLRAAGCSIVTIGQYLPPSLRHHEVNRYAPPAEFQAYQRIGLAMGFRAVVAGPLVRSSFRAAQVYQSLREIPSGRPLAMGDN